jgi:ABC-2 type transport system permease protein
MTFSMKRVSAIVRKEYMDLMKNYQIVIVGFIPVIMAAIFSRFDGMEPAYIASLCIMMTLVLVGTSIQANMISEEKEKNTLRGLMLSPASTMEVLTGKSIITLIYSAVICALCLVLTGAEGNIGLVVLISLIGALAFMGIGTMISLVTNSVSAMNLVLVPILLLLMYGSMFVGLVEHELVRDILNNLVTTQIGESLSLVLKGEGFSAITHNLLVMSAWFAVSLIACIIVYRKKRFD